MLRKLQQAYPNRDTRPLDINKGGTNAKTAPQAVENLNAVPISIVGQPEGIAPLGSGGKIPVQFLGSGEIHSVSLSGPAELGLNTSGQYQITDYDFDTVYTAITTDGTVSVNVDIVTFTPPAAYGTYTFTLNDDIYTVSVVPPYIKKPIILRPRNNAINTMLTFDSHSSLFKSLFITDTHISSSWEFSTNANFVDDNEGSLLQINDDPNHLIHYRLTAFNDEMGLNSTSYVRVRYKGSILGYSEWSDPVKFTTRPILYPTLSTKRLAREDIKNGDTGYKEDFGTSIACNKNGDVLIISSLNCDYVDQNTNSNYVGGVFIHYFDHDQDLWIRKQILQNPYDYNSSDPNQSAAGGYGCSVAISEDGNTVVIGARYSSVYSANEVFNSCGNVYVYKTSIYDDFSSFVQYQEIKPDSLSNYLYFGSRVAITPNGEYIGVLTENSSIDSLYIYKDTAGSYSSILSVTPTNSTNAYSSLAMTNTTLVCGSSYESNGGAGVYQRGIVDIFNLSNSTWSLDDTLLSTNTVGNFNIDSDHRYGYGRDLAISGDGSRLVVRDAIDLYIYSKTNNVWALSDQIPMSDWADYTYYDLNKLQLNYFGTLLLVSSINIGKTFSDPSIGQHGGFGVTKLYERNINTWIMRSDLELPIIADSTYFGTSLAINGIGTMFAISANNTNDVVTGTNHDNSGQVLIYT